MYDKRFKMKHGTATKKPIPQEWYYFENIMSVPGLKQWVSMHGKNFLDHFSFINDEVKVGTLEGTSYNLPDDYYIMRGARGEYYPCEGSIFRDTYDIVSETINHPIGVL